MRNTNPKYCLLMQEATKRFSKAVSAAAQAAGHDVVAEVGTVDPNEDGLAAPPDLTDEVIRHLK